jgi:phosphopantothenoylcysteine synthetase/decarboxylase
MDPIAILQEFGFPVMIALSLGYLLWKQQHWIQDELIEELEERFKRIEMIVIKLIDQQKKMQIEQRGILKSYQALVEIITKLLKKEDKK